MSRKEATKEIQDQIKNENTTVRQVLNGLGYTGKVLLDILAKILPTILEKAAYIVFNDPAHPISVFVTTALQGREQTWGEYLTSNARSLVNSQYSGLAKNLLLSAAKAGLSSYVLPALPAFSTERVKKDIQDFDLQTCEDDLSQFSPVVFSYIDKLQHLNDKKEDGRYLGLIAEEVAKINPLYVTYDKDGRPDNIDDRALMMLLLHFVRKHEQQINQVGSF